MTRLPYLTLLLGVLWLAPLARSMACPPGNVLRVNSDFKEECVACGANCTTCFLMENKTPKCFFCKEGFYLDKTSPQGECKPCVQGCSRCIGGSLKQCSDTLPGYFYDQEIKGLTKCDESCARCHSKNECSMCAEGFFARREEKVEKKEGASEVIDELEKTLTDIKDAEKKMMKFGNDFLDFKFREKDVKCINCNIDNCVYCSEKQDQVKKNKFITCSLCQPKFGLVDGHCQNCPQNCRYCKEQTLECVSCEKGYQWNSKTNTCDLISIENCAVVKNEVCAVCDNFFYLDKEENACKPCGKEIKNCSHCHSTGKQVKCQFCQRGYYLPNDGSLNNFLIALKSLKDGKEAPSIKMDAPSECKKCNKNCNHCDGDRCYICKKGFYYSEKSNKCLTCDIENCDQCLSKQRCGICSPGFFVKKGKKTCSPCPRDCLKCSASGHCQSCPIDHFILLEEKITHSKSPNILSSILGMFLGAVATKLPPVEMTQVEIHTKCVEECPKEIDGQEVTVNLAERKCIVKSKGEEAPLPPISLPFLSESDSIYHNINQLKFHYEEQIGHIKKVGLAKKPEEKSQVSSECFNNGLIRKVFRGNLSSYFICRCLPGFMGDNCQITTELHNETQNKLLALLEKIKKQLPSMSKNDYKEVLSSLILFNKFKIDVEVVSKILEVLGFLLDRNRGLDNKKKLYVLYDSLILSVFDMLEDLRKAKPKDLMGNSDLQKQELELQKKIEKLVVLIETSLEDMDYSKSFLAKQKDEYIGLDTFSFIISEYPLNTSTFQLSNPNIDTSFNTEESTEIQLLVNGDHPNSKFNVQLITFSVTLFNFEFNRYQLLTNPLYFKFLDPSNAHVQVNNADALVRGVQINFPLLFLPGYENLEKHLFCKTFKTNHYDDSKTNGTVLKFDEDTGVVTCEYLGISSFSNMYFGVFILKRDSLD